ncbi:hypothetical protein ACJX0J_008619, partial [Zea mays]
HSCCLTPPTGEEQVIVCATSLCSFARGVLTPIELPPKFWRLNQSADIGDIVIGTVLGPGSHRANECRMAALFVGFPETVPIRTVNRQCSSGLQAVADVAAAIKVGYYDIISAFQKAHDCLLPMGITSENVAHRYGVTRQEQDQAAVSNSSQVSEGAGVVVLMKRSMALKKGLPILGVFRSFAAVGVDPAIMGIGPVVAILAAVKSAGLEIGDIDLFELNEAFASQFVYCCNKLGLDRSKVNVNGGAIFLGHPLGAIGVRCVATLLNEMKRRGRDCKFGVVTMCI